MKKPIIILGAGGHARVVANVLILNGAQVLGVTDPKGQNLTLGSSVFPCLGSDAGILKRHSPSRVMLANGVGSVVNDGVRKRLFVYFSTRGYRFVNIVHPSATVAFSVLAEEGTQIMAGAVVQPGCRLGKNSLINTSASIDHDSVIGEHVHVAPGAIVCGGVRIGSGTHIGSGAILIQGVQIGSNQLVKAGTLVKRNIVS